MMIRVYRRGPRTPRQQQSIPHDGDDVSLNCQHSAASFSSSSSSSVLRHTRHLNRMKMSAVWVSLCWKSKRLPKTSSSSLFPPVFYASLLCCCCIGCEREGQERAEGESMWTWVASNSRENGTVIAPSSFSFVFVGSLLSLVDWEIVRRLSRQRDDWHGRTKREWDNYGHRSSVKLCIPYQSNWKAERESQ